MAEFSRNVSNEGVRKREVFGWAMAVFLAPELRCAEFFAQWTFAGRLVVIVGPLICRLVTWVTFGTSRPAILFTGLSFGFGLKQLRHVDKGRGERAAAQAV